MQRIQAIIAAPTFNNAGTLANVLERLTALQLPVVVVDDGSTDQTSTLLHIWKQLTGGAQRFVITHSVNRGKAAALRSAFALALQMGFTHAITIDTDGQLEPEQIPELLAAAEGSPSALVLGWRDERQADYPARSRIGRRVSNFLVRLESGVRVTDSQCGLRVYPLELVRFLPRGAQRYAFETQVLTLAAWCGCEFVEVPVRCHYPSGHERVSHFRPWLDTWRSVAMHLPLVTRALVPLPQRRWPMAPPRNRAILKQILQGLNPAAAWRELRQDSVAKPALAVALGLGVLIANLPVYGLQTILGIYSARRLHLNPLAVVLGTQASTPPIGAALIALGMAVGHLLLHGALPVWADYNVHALGFRRVVWPLLLEWTLGGFVVGVVLGILTFFLSLLLFRRIAPCDTVWSYREPAEASSAGPAHG